MLFFSYHGFRELIYKSEYLTVGLQIMIEMTKSALIQLSFTKWLRPVAYLTGVSFEHMNRNRLTMSDSSHSGCSNLMIYLQCCKFICVEFRNISVGKMGLI